MSKWDRIKVALWEEEVITALTNEPDDPVLHCIRKKMSAFTFIFSSVLFTRRRISFIYGMIVLLVTY
jgi:hypothetical protein